VPSPFGTRADARPERPAKQPDRAAHRPRPWRPPNNEPSTCRRPARPSWHAIARTLDETIEGPPSTARASLGGTSRPVVPGTTRSGIPPTDVATTGSSDAMASSNTSGKPSVRDGRANTSERGVAKTCHVSSHTGHDDVPSDVVLHNHRAKGHRTRGHHPRSRGAVARLGQGPSPSPGALDTLFPAPADLWSPPPTPARGNAELLVARRLVQRG